VENAGTGQRLTPSAVDVADAEERSRSAALRARIAILAAGPDPEPVLSGPLPDLSSAVGQAVRDVLPAVVRDEVRLAVSAALPGLLAPIVAEAFRQQRDDIVGVVSREVTELRASVVANAALPSLSPDALLVEMVSLRADVVRALDTTHQQLTNRVTEHFAAIRADLRSDINSEVAAGTASVAERIRRSLGGQIGAALSPVREEFEATAESHRADVSNLADEVRSSIVEQLDTLRAAVDEIDHLGENLRSTLTAYADEQLAVLESTADRGGTDLADLSDNVQSQLEEFAGRVAGDLETIIAAGRESLAAVGPSVRGDVQSVTSLVRTDVEALTAAVHTDVEQLATRVRRETDALAAAVRGDVESLVASARADLTELTTEVRTTLATELAAAIESSRDGAVQGVTAAVETGIEHVRGVVSATEQEIAANRSEVALFSDRFTRAGKALLDHLAARDLLLEQARDALLAELLADLISGMNDRDRGAAIRRLTQVTQRRRDARDAERWREGRPAAPKFPADVESEHELVALLDTAAPLPDTSLEAGLADAADVVTSAPMVEATEAEPTVGTEAEPTVGMEAPVGQSETPRSLDEPAAAPARSRASKPRAPRPSPAGDARRTRRTIGDPAEQPAPPAAPDLPD
jgi:Skp family chaperone for outer membrane proteins